MGAELRVGLQQIQNAEQMVVGIGKRRRGGRVQRHVEVDAPFGVGCWQLGAGSGSERIGQVAVDFACAGGVAFHDLVQVDVVGKFF